MTLHLRNLITLFTAITAYFCAAQEQGSRVLQVDLLNNSSLVVLGETNVNNYECSIIKGTSDRVQTEATYQPDRISFRDAVLSFEVADFDCGLMAITREFQKALRSDNFPTIQLQIKTIYSDEADREQKLLNVKSDVSISLAGESKTMTIDFERERINSSDIRYRATPELLMSDFGVDPPRVLFGSIKADDAIRVEVDVVFRVKE